MVEHRRLRNPCQMPAKRHARTTDARVQLWVGRAQQLRRAGEAEAIATRAAKAASGESRSAVHHYFDDDQDELPAKAKAPLKSSPTPSCEALPSQTRPSTGTGTSSSTSNGTSNSNNGAVERGRL